MRNWIWTGAVCLGLLTAAAAPGQDAADTKFFQKVMDRLLSSDRVQRSYPSKYAWPPKSFVKPDSAKEVNAYASAHKAHGATLDEKTGKVRPVVMVTEGMLREIIKGDENSLAVIMGHELAHLAKDHVGGRKGETPLLLLAFNRDQEIEADLEGLRYAVAAGYPYKLGVTKAIQAMRARGGASSFEGLGDTHPSWEDRLIFLDREQSQLWSSMSAFQNGYLFLELEQYLAARQCFKAVVTEFPDCYEAWANLGYAQLMQYCDGLERDDLRRYGIGHIVTGGFYARPSSLESKVRGIDEKLWHDAVKALNRALALKADLVLPRANLGTAYLVHPEGKDVKQASKWFAEALDHFARDAGLKKNPLAVAAVLVNAAVADLARGDTGATAAKLKEALQLLGSAEGTPVVKTLEEALYYNHALLDAASPDVDKKQRACKLFELYLVRACPDSAWWPLALDRYAKLSGELGLPVRDRQDLTERFRPARLRLATSVAVGAETVSLSAPLQDAVAHLGANNGVAVPLFPGSKIVRWHFAERGIDLLGKEKVLAIFLVNDRAPPVIVQAFGVATKGQALRVGMSEDDAKKLLKEQRADLTPRPIDDPDVQYVSYPELGLAIRFARQRVREIAIAQVPRVSLAGK